MPDAEIGGGAPPAGEGPEALPARVADEIARAPESWGTLTPEPRRRRPPGARLAAAVFFLVAALALTLVLTARLRRPPGADAPASPGTLLRPIEPARDAATGEEIAPFSGFAVSVETQPPGALVSVAGIARGEAPVFAGVDCAPGERVEVRAQKAGLAATRATICRADTLVKLRLRLGR